MSLRGRFDAEKATEVILYIARQRNDMYTALKILYFADKEHLAKYGRLICGDMYIAMKDGPVPSGAYDLVKVARGDGFCQLEQFTNNAFQVENNDIIIQREPDCGYLSETDIECLDWAIENFGHLSFSALKNKSHDKAYEAADRNGEMDMEIFIKSLPNGTDILEYMHPK